jgi:hypothetical protein
LMPGPIIVTFKIIPSTTSNANKNPLGNRGKVNFGITTIDFES